MAHRTGIRSLVTAALVIAGLGQASQAQATPVLVLGPDGHTTIQNQPLPSSITPAPLRARARAAASPRARHANVLATLGRLELSGAISSSAYSGYASSLRSALSADKRLGGTAARELGAVIGNLRQITAEGMLTPARLPALFLTLDRNRQWWTTGPVPGSGQIVSFAGSQVDWEYYAGQGIELQQLASFGKASYLMSHGASGYPQGIALLNELVPLASRRAGGLTWEYYFNFDGGAPPWTSAMSQGTALQALAHAYTATGNSSYLSTAAASLPVFMARPARGVSVRTPRGLRFVQYTFDPARSDEVINAFLQSLIGLYTYAQASGNPRAWRLFNRGNAEAEHELPSFDTGSWSLYQPGVQDSLSYHKLVTGFAQQLCSITHARVYCRTAARFQSYLGHVSASLAR